MRLILRILFLIVVILWSCGCVVQSIHPFYVQDAVVQAPANSGEWLMLDRDNEIEKSVKPWVFGDDKILTYDGVKSGVVAVVYFKIEETLFMDVTALLSEGLLAPPNEQANFYWLLQAAHVHTICRVKLQTNSLTLTPIDGDWIDKAIDDKSLNLSFIRREVQEWESLLFTASSQEWMTFLKKYGNDDEVFSEEHAMKFVRRTTKAKQRSNKSMNHDKP